jgi:hypothetical protein
MIVLSGVVYLPADRKCGKNAAKISQKASKNAHFLKCLKFDKNNFPFFFISGLPKIAAKRKTFSHLKCLNHI